MMLKDQKTAIIEANRTHDASTSSPSTSSSTPTTIIPAAVCTR